MTEIIPAIIGKDFAEIRAKAARVEGLVDWVQVDVTDGIFASGYTWENPADLAGLDGKLKVEVHLMIEEPEQYLADWLAVADRVIFHYEATTRLAEILEQFAGLPTKLGLALLLETPVEKLAPVAERFDLIQLMSIGEIGHYGASFVPAIVEKVRALRQAQPNVKIAVDGGVNLTNARELLTAGANQLVVGSAIWDSADPAAAIAAFKNL